MSERLQIRCLRKKIEIGSRQFPVYMGFARPTDLVRVAVAPSFKAKASHREIANRVLEPPVSDWQRPLDMDRIDTIAQVFSTSDDLMPNPVLLSENVDHKTSLEPSVLKNSDGTPTELWEVACRIPESNEAKPLWILDGQHRINGLAKSSQSSNLIPVVMLINGGTNAYQGRDFAHIFAQVTVTAVRLNSIHEEWLTYAYELEQYSTGNPSAQQQRLAFETVAHMCGKPRLGVVAANPWLNSITFNPEADAGGATNLDGFRYSAPELKEILLRWYFEAPAPPGGHLESEDLAEQLAAAYLALKGTVAQPHQDTVFFGRTNFAHRVMQDGFLAGVLARLAASGPPTSWTDVLRRLNFVETDWNFNEWASTRGGNAGNTSRRLAETVLPLVMRSGRLPEGIDNLADYLKGNNCEVAVLCRRLNAKGRAIKAGELAINLTRGNKITRDIGDRVHVKVVKPGASLHGAATTPNIGKIDVYDGLKKGSPQKYPQAVGRGLLLQEIGEGKAELDISMEHYGAERSNASLALKWKF